MAGENSEGHMPATAITAFEQNGGVTIVMTLPGGRAVYRWLAPGVAAHFGQDVTSAALSLTFPTDKAR